MAGLSPREVREQIRTAKWTRPTSGLCLGYQQANMVIMPAKYAADFEAFCRANPGPCPLLAVVPAGETEIKKLAKGSDVRTDLPSYRVFKDGQFVEQVSDIKALWRDDLVSFFLGCSFGFERALQEGGIEVRNITEGKNVSMYTTNIQCTPVGPFNCPMVVSMRPIPVDKVETAIQVTGNIALAHGRPVHMGDPAAIGIRDIAQVDFGDAVTIRDGETPVFWACGVTSALAALSAKPDLVITHAPGCMLVTDVRDSEHVDDDEHAA
ncbi:uncharacterized protein ACA1_145250 [Acanthamoeba castellanii str. Neff]|uniref:Hydro-lyase n=1 Tax=Acanthamoeba castellanii (strain ATCC 30010 / Neff) TaxID=1257118 RepID=L8GDG1_ACACF|nr:uncharacterized protein ACA1_145250 [Acanthamoeba castellanii str. Neff]ELR10904.1 hypothetical protein ACA1_145250 [Acanthamoeba castellanii str. Neff]